MCADFCFFVNSVSGFIPPVLLFHHRPALKECPCPFPPRPLTPQARRSGAKNPVHSRAYRTPYWDTSRIEGLHFLRLGCALSFPYCIFVHGFHSTVEITQLVSLCSVSDYYSLWLYHRERILETSTLSCNEEEEEITKPPKR